MMIVEVVKYSTDRTPEQMREDAEMWRRAKYPDVAVGRYRDAADQLARLTADFVAALQEVEVTKKISDAAVRECARVQSELAGLRKILKNLRTSTLERQLYISLRAMPCRCEYARNSAGVPLWFPIEGGGIERKRLSHCSRCQGVEQYESNHPEELFPTGV